MDSTTIDRPRGSREEADASRPRPRSRPLNLALQGGGAHGAFTWGVLDRLLEDERISFEGVSATSAGAMKHRAVLAYGLGEGGREGAKKALSRFWLRVSHAAAMGPLQPSMIDRALHDRARGRTLAGLCRARLHDASVLALPAQSRQPQPAAACGGAVGRLQAAARAVAGQPIAQADEHSRDCCRRGDAKALGDEQAERQLGVPHALA